MKKIKYDLIIFDWDGTIMDSISRIVSCLQASAQELDLAVPSVKSAKSIIGLSLPEAMISLFPDACENQVAALVEEYRSQYVDKNNTPCDLFADAKDLLHELREQGCTLAIATGKSRSGLERVFKQTGLAHLFSSTRCAGECISKPHPQMLEQILLETELHCHNSIYIGDSVHDLNMAQQAGMHAIGVTTGANEPSELALYQPKAIVDSLSELRQHLIL